MLQSNENPQQMIEQTQGTMVIFILTLDRQVGCQHAFSCKSDEPKKKRQHNQPKARTSKHFHYHSFGSASDIGSIPIIERHGAGNKLQEFGPLSKGSQAENASESLNLTSSEWQLI